MASGDGITLQALATAAGLMPVWQDAFGETQYVGDQSLACLLAELGFPCASRTQIEDSNRRLRAEEQEELGASPGRLWVIDAGAPLDFSWQGALPYRLELESGRRIDGTASQQEPGRVRIAPIDEPGYHSLYIGDARLSLAVCPLRSPWLPTLTRTGQSDRAKAAAWGIAAQVYSLGRAGRQADAGDFAALADLAAQAGQAGASALMISPVHALFSAAPGRYSPYSPSSRLFLNVAYADPAQVFGREAVALAAGGGLADMSALRAAGWDELAGSDHGKTLQPDTGTGTIDWAVLIPARLAIMRRIFEQFDRNADTPQARDFRQFCAAGGQALEHHARYEALSADYCQRLGPDSGWQDWPPELHHPDSAATRRYAGTHRAEVDFHCFLQWLADRGLSAAQAAAQRNGMCIGLISDLAIGTDPRGSHAWSQQTDILRQVSVGAPPDLFQPLGQSWGITAFSPHALRSGAYAGFINTLRASLRHAGGIRIDHIMGLARMWLVPRGASAGQGVYLRYPFEDMLRLLVLEAFRHKALVIGENLGTVTPAFNDSLKAKNILGTSVLWFQHNLPWPDWTMATTTTHDLPTIEGWWSARDIKWREQLGELTPEQARLQREARSTDKAALLRTLPSGGTAQSGADVAPRQAILSQIGSTPSPLVIVPIEDIIGVVEQPNLPGTVSGGPGHPSWIQRLPLPVEGLLDRAVCRESLDSIRQGRAARQAESKKEA